MTTTKSKKIFSQLQRELQEYRNSILLMPIGIAGLLVLLMLGSVIIAGRVSIIGDGVMQVLAREEGDSGLSISINLDDIDRSQTLIITEEEGAIDEAEWNFSSEWTFSTRDHREEGGHMDAPVESLNPVLNGLHALFLVLMFFVSINYLLGSLYQDRKDRSILFWKSLPVSEWQEVLCKLAVASVLTPLAFLAASILTQLAYTLLAMLLVWRLDAGPVSLVVGNIQFVPLFLNQIGGMLIWAMFTLPVYAWLMVASAGARRSPFMWAFGVPIALIFVEKVFIGSDYMAHSISRHLPHLLGGNDAGSMGMYSYGPVWSSIDYLGMVLGVVVAAGLVSLAVWLRRHRFET
jgi:ABC-2 type transport system permease protein